MRRTSVWLVALCLGLAVTLVSKDPAPDARLKRAARSAERGGWIKVHLEGSPKEIGFQHGYLLAEEIRDAFKVISTEMQHDEKRDWNFFRNAARDVLWPNIEQEYRDELQAIPDGMAARGGVKLDVWDIAAMNAWLELPYYVRSLDGAAAAPIASEHCSAFAATGNYTKDGRVVIGHNNWTSYSTASRWNIVFDIVPQRGYHILMDGMPGLIHSGDDFGLNSAGLIITETTISGFKGFDPAGIAEFVRARKAMQYAGNIDQFTAIMKAGNNGGYANNWLLADRKNNEVASLELGLKNVILQRTSNGYFVGANFPADPKLIREETTFDASDRSKSANARHDRWLTLMAQSKGQIDMALGEKFLADHFDAYEGVNDPNERTLCGHVDLSPRGQPGWQEAYGPAGTAQNKIADAASAAKMSFTAAMGHACGLSFKAAKHLQAHPEFAWTKYILRDLDSRGWTKFKAK
jgi:hypothetical protein